MSTKHTPGPWGWNSDFTALYGAELDAIHQGETCAECGHSPTECGPNILGIATPELSQEVLDDPDMDWKPNEADASLIAAAPDLLMALQRLSEAFCGGPEWDGVDIAEQARSAIAKAMPTT